MTNLPFTTLDSFAFWNVPNNMENIVTIDEAREKCFGENYKPYENQFPSDQLPADLAGYLSQMKYVLVGMNRGNAAVDTPTEQNFLNFHGLKKSLDYRLAAVTYGTPLWGAFMTDLSQTIESKSELVDFTADDVAALEKHLDELGVPADATLVAIGKVTYTTLQKFAHRPVATIPHYSSSNSRNWNATTVHAEIANIVK